MDVYALIYKGKIIGIYSSVEQARQVIESEAVYLYDNNPDVRWNPSSCYKIQVFTVDGENDRNWCIVYVPSREYWDIYEINSDLLNEDSVDKVDDRGHILYKTHLSHHSQGEALRLGKERI